ncbi:N-6 DNA methylase [Candidatus Oscillochloris fontis]|uniref:N-6 DNA methylase n=1 Tax=Candidatus Oscillochloris fontis TaxID=2496868 RepID=UPI00101C532D|nr:N-6 DNA methylase [Candidatus Oscillochloris fontis]
MTTSHSAVTPPPAQTPIVPIDIFDAFRTQVIDRVQVRMTHSPTPESYVTYLARPASERDNDEAAVVDVQFTRYVLEWLGFTQGGDVIYNRTLPGGGASRPDYVVQGTIGIAFIWEDKNSSHDDFVGDLPQMRRYSGGTAGYAVWCNMRRIIAVRFRSSDPLDYEHIATINVANLFGAGTTLLPPVFEAERNQLSVFYLLFRKERFTRFSSLIDAIAVDEKHFLARAIPLEGDAALEQFIAGSRQSLEHLRLAALARIQEALVGRSRQAEEEQRLIAEWETATALFLTTMAYPSLQAPIQNAAASITERLGTLNATDIAALARIVETAYGGRLTASSRAAVMTWQDRAVRINGAMRAIRYQSTAFTIADAYYLWCERQNDEADKTPTIYAEQVAYVLFVRLLLVRVLEDKGIISPRLASDGGFQNWQTYVQLHFKEVAGVSILTDNFYSLLVRKASRYYLHFFQQAVFDWFVPDDFLLLETLYFLCHYSFQHVTSDVIGFTYERYIDRTARKRKGHFLTPASVVDSMLDALGYTGRVMIGRNLLDPACGSGSFLLRAARRYRTALIESLCQRNSLPVGIESIEGNAILRHELAQRYLDALTTAFVGMERNPFACYLAEMNLLIQALDDFSILHGIEPKPIERFAIFNTDSLDLPLEVLFAGSPGSFGPLTIPKRLSDQLLDDAFVIKARQGDYQQGFMYIIANPPYVTSKQEDVAATRFRGSPFWASALSGDTNLYLLFLQLGLYYLADGGQMAYIVPLTIIGDASAAAMRLRSTTTPFSLHRVIRFFRGDILFGDVDQAVGILCIHRQPAPTTITVGGGAQLADVPSNMITVSANNVTEAVPEDDIWHRAWLVGTSPEQYDIWQYVRMISDTFAYQMRTLLAACEVRQGDVNATYTNPFRRGSAGRGQRGAVAIYKGENVRPFAPLPDEPSDWAIPTTGATGNQSRAATILTEIATLSSPQMGIVLRETARLNTRERLTPTWFTRDSTHPVAFTHVVWRMVLLPGHTEARGKALLALLSSTTVAYLLNLFSTNSHISKDELERLPIPDPSTFPEAQLTSLADSLLDARRVFEVRYAQPFAIPTDSFPTLSPETITVLPTAYVRRVGGGTITLDALEQQGIITITGPISRRVAWLHQNNRISIVHPHAAVHTMLNRFFDDPTVQGLKWAVARTIRVPDPATAGTWLPVFEGVCHDAQAQWDQCVTLQQQIDTVVMTWYQCTPPMCDAITAMLPWARRHR